MFKRLIAGFGKKPLPAVAILQEDVVRSVVGNIRDLHDGEWEGREWVYIAVNHEMSVEDGGRSSSQSVVLVRKGELELEALGFRLSTATRQKLIALREAMCAAGQEPWSILDLTIERDGPYDFTFSYAPPPRLDGDLLHQPLKDILARYRAQGRWTSP